MSKSDKRKWGQNFIKATTELLHIKFEIPQGLYIYLSYILSGDPFEMPKINTPLKFKMNCSPN